MLRNVQQHIILTYKEQIKMTKLFLHKQKYIHIGSFACWDGFILKRSFCYEKAKNETIVFINFVSKHPTPVSHDHLYTSIGIGIYIQRDGHLYIYRDSHLYIYRDGHRFQKRQEKLSFLVSFWIFQKDYFQIFHFYSKMIVFIPKQSFLILNYPFPFLKTIF